MVIDTSAIIAILLMEEESALFINAIYSASTRLISTCSLLEATMVLNRTRKEEGVKALDLFVEEAMLEVIPFDREQLKIARDAFAKYGKGNHKAKLNFGDCFSYALAKAFREPLLFKGNDFSLTDIESAIVELS